MKAKLPPAVITAMAMRDLRAHHWLFHTVRNGWWFFSQAQRTKLKAMGWEPPRPAMRPTATGSTPELKNNSGEDFLFMHREMIRSVNAILTQAGQADYPRVEGWQQIPAPNDADYPVPPAWTSGDAGLDAHLESVKSDQAFAQFQQWEKDYTDSEKLRGWTLGELGAMIEYTIHNAMHMRWCENPGSFRDEGDLFATIDTKWDAASYDWLGDTYSSHVNATFWKLHGWIDDRIEDWKAANNVSEIQWKGTWVGPAGHGGHMHAKAAAGTVDMATSASLKDAIAVVGKSDFRHRLWSAVEFPSDAASPTIKLAAKANLTGGDDKEIILAGVKDAIMEVSKAKPEQIVLKSKIKTFVPVLVAGAFVVEIDERFPEVEPKELLDALFDSVNTVGELVDFIAEASNA